MDVMNVVHVINVMQWKWTLHSNWMKAKPSYSTCVNIKKNIHEWICVFDTHVMSECVSCLWVNMCV